MAADRKTKGEPHNVPSCNLEEPKSVPRAGEKTKKLSSPERKAALQGIPLKPFLCTISRCPRYLTVSDLLSHALYEHLEDFRFIKTYAGVRTVFDCEISKFRLGEAKSLGLICYSGTTKASMENTSQQPGERLICLPNKHLIGSYESLKFVLPIYVMACRTSWGLAPLAAKERKYYVPKANEDFMVFWLRCAPTLKILHSTMTAYNQALTKSLSSLLEVCQCQSPPGLKSIMTQRNQQLLWKSGPAEAGQKVLIEVSIDEFDLKLQE